MENLDAESIVTLIKSGAAALAVAVGSKPAAMLIEKVAAGLGWALNPTTIRRNAKAEADASLTKADADHLIKEREQRIAARIANEENKRQLNMEAVLLQAIPNVKEDAKPEDIDDDWLTSFFEKCRHVSNKEMQKLWAQVLAGEANQPGAFSARTLVLLVNLSQEDALLFKEFCSYVWASSKGLIPNVPQGDSLPLVAVVPDYLLKESFLRDTLGKEGRDMSKMLHLQHAGLISVSNKVVNIHTYRGGLGLTYHNRRFTVLKKTGLFRNKRSHIIMGFPLGKVHLTEAGQQLASICDPTPDWSYAALAIKKWEAAGFELVELPQASD